MKTLCSKMLLTIASLLLIAIAPGESIDGFDDEDEMIGCFLRLACTHNKVEEFYNIAKEAGPENYQSYVDAFNKAMAIINLEITGNNLQYWIQLTEKMCDVSREQQKTVFNDVSATNGEYLMELCMDADSEACVKAEMAMDEFSTVLNKYKASGLCPLSEEADKMEPPLDL